MGHILPVALSERRKGPSGQRYTRKHTRKCRICINAQTTQINQLARTHFFTDFPTPNYTSEHFVTAPYSIPIIYSTHTITMAAAQPPSPDWTPENDPVFSDRYPKFAHIKNVSQPQEHAQPQYRPPVAYRYGLRRFVPTVKQVDMLKCASRGPVCIVDGKKTKCHKSNVLPAYMYQ